MKSPRDLLLERHRDQSAALDQLRERVIAQELGADTAAAPQGRTGLQPVFERTEMMAPSQERSAQLTPAANGIGASVLSSKSSPAAGATAAPAGDRLQTCPTLLACWFACLNWQRAAWSGFAAVWCVILGLNVAAQSETETSVAANAPVNSREFLAGLQENRAQLAALLFDQNDSGDEAAARKAKPAPRGAADRPRKDAFHLNSAFV